MLLVGALALSGTGMASYIFCSCYDLPEGSG